MIQVKRYDLSQIGKAEVTPQGFLKVPGFATRVGVFTYRTPDGSIRRELRHPDDVFDPKSMATLQNAPVTLEHPPEMVTPDNSDIYLKGYCTEKVGVNRDLIEAELIITHKDAIKAVNDGLRELSCGYLADLEEENGTYNGAEYDHRQRNIKYNHLALVKKGRGGPEIRLRMDSNDAVMCDLNENGVKIEHADSYKPKGDSEMDMKKVKIGDQEVEMPKSAAKIVEDMFDRYDEIKGASMKEEEKGDNDLSSNVGANIPDKEMAPDGVKALKKVNSADTDGPEKAAGKADEEGPDGVAKAPAEELADAMEEMKGKLDAANAKLDEYAAKEMNPKMDSADNFNLRVANRVTLLQKASAVSGKEMAKFDGLSDDEIRSESIKAVHSNFDGAGKSSVYLEARFDSITEQIDVADRLRKGTYDKKRMDKYESVDATGARNKYVSESMNAWKQPLSKTK